MQTYFGGIPKGSLIKSHITVTNRDLTYIRRSGFEVRGDEER